MKEHAKVEHLQHALDGEDGREPVIEQAQLLVSDQEKYLKDVDFDQGKVMVITMMVMMNLSLSSLTGSSKARATLLNKMTNMMNPSKKGRVTNQ